MGAKGAVGGEGFGGEGAGGEGAGGAARVGNSVRAVAAASTSPPCSSSDRLHNFMSAWGQRCRSCLMAAIVTFFSAATPSTGAEGVEGAKGAECAECAKGAEGAEGAEGTKDAECTASNSTTTGCPAMASG